MKTTEVFRNQLGLSQEMMAFHLRVKRSQLSMYELGKRELPTIALVKLAEISVFLNQNKIIDEQGTELQTEQEQQLKKFLELQIRDLEYKKLKEQRLLENIQKKYQQNVTLHAFALHLRKNNLSLAEVLLQQAIKGLKQYGLVSQAKQASILQGINSQIDYIQSLKETQT